MSKKPPKKIHKVRRTVLIVGEGYAEIQLLKYFKQLYHPREAGFTIKLNNAHGKGASHVVDHAIGQRRNIAYDVAAVLFDTDTDWNAAVRQRANEHGLVLFPSTPCLEAELLRIHVRGEVNDTPDNIKRRFTQRYEAHAHELDYGRHFPAADLDPIVQTEAVLGRLIQLIQTGYLP